VIYVVAGGLAAGAGVVLVMVRVLFKMGWLTRPCGRCGAMVLPWVNGRRFTYGEHTACLCDECVMAEGQEWTEQLTEKYAVDKAGDA